MTHPGTDPFRPYTRHDSAGYPLDRWLDGQVWELEQGVDYQSSAVNLGRYLYKLCRSLGTTARRKVVQHPDGRVVLLFQHINRDRTPISPPEPAEA